MVDEVGEIPLDVQVALLRALQEGEIDRVGGTESVKVDVRVIAATNRDTKQMVRDGHFREDLYYRLQGMVIVVPPLRSRREELSGLVRHFVMEIVSEGHAPLREFTSDAMDELFGQDWPGNIRQLRTTVFRALVLARGAVVRRHDIRAALVGGSAEALAELPPLAAQAGEGFGASSVPGEQVGDAVLGDADAVRGALPADQAESLVASPRPEVEPELVPELGERPVASVSGRGADGLAPRLLELLSRVRELGRFTTQDHMTNSGASHRTALRDLQALVKKGFIERVGSRRGAFYRPLGMLGESWPKESTDD